MSEQVKQLFTKIAPRYDFINSVLSLRVDRSWRREAVKILQGEKFRDVLDLCAGTLALSAMLLKGNRFCKITAVDFSPEMLQTGLKKLPYGYLPRISVETADAHSLTFASESFDGVMCAYGMRNLEDNKKALEEIHRMLKPDGKVVILDFFAPDCWSSRFFHATYGSLFIPTVGRLISHHKDAYRYLKNSIRGFYTPAAYVELMKSIGFRNVTLKRQTGGISCLITADS